MLHRNHGARRKPNLAPRRRSTPERNVINTSFSVGVLGGPTPTVNAGRFDLSLISGAALLPGGQSPFVRIEPL